MSTKTTNTAAPSQLQLQLQPLPPDLLIKVVLVRRDTATQTFTELSPSVWRRFRLSSSTQLDLLHDKILSPIMGWERNYHTYCFRKLRAATSSTTSSSRSGDVDPSIGTKIYLQADTQAVDLMHAPDHVGMGHAVRPEEATIGDLMQEAGDRCLYTYDLGDSWYHVLTLEAILGESGDDNDGNNDGDKMRMGRVRLLDGSMRCPDEDGGGCARYQGDVLDLILRLRSSDSPHDCDAVARELARACFEDRRNALNVMASFRPEEFDAEERRSALGEALSSRGSARNSVKQFGGMMTMMFGGDRPGKILGMAGLGQRSIICRREHEAGMHETAMLSFKETINVKPDSREATLCCNCGSPYGRDDGERAGPLRACGRCHIPHYCSRQCQSEHWTSTHKKQCKTCQKDYQRYQRELEADKPDPNRFDIPTEDRMLKRYDPTNLRFAPNTCVECMVGDNQWKIGYIVQTLYKQSEESDVSAYQILIPDIMQPGGYESAATDDGVVPFIHAPWDDDYQVRQARPGQDRYPSNAAKMEFMGRVRYEFAPFIAGTSTAGSRGMEDEYNTWPGEWEAQRVHRLLERRG